MKLSRAFLAISFLEGIAAILVFVQITPSASPNGYSGLSAARWVVVLAASASTLFLAVLFVRSFLDPRWFSLKLEAFFDRLHLEGRWPTALLASFFAFVFTYAAPFLIQMFLPGYRKLLLQMLPLVAWVGLLLFQFLVILLKFYFRAYPEARWPTNENLKLPKTAVRLFLLSLIVRALLGFIVIRSGLPIAFDETGYYGLASNLEAIMDSLMRVESPSADLLQGAYGDGRWPLFHPFIMALGMFIFGPHPSSSRVMMIFISALTSPLVYLLVNKIAKKERIAFYTAMIHIFYPTFLAYSHYLWSETTYLFLFLASIYTLLLMFESRKTARLFVLAAICGLLVGLGALTRSTMLPFFIVIPALIAIRFNNRLWRYAPPLIFGAVVLMVTLPWISILTVREGTLTLFGTNGGYTLYLSNNSWLPEESFGSSMEFRSTRDTVRDSIDRFRRENRLSDGAAASILARNEIKDHPADFIFRTLERVRYFISGDSFIVRHFVHAVYPPVHASFVVTIWALYLLSYILLITFIGLGLVAAANLIRRKGTFLILASVGMLLPAITIANSRYYLPTMVTLLPFAGAGIFHIMEIGRQKRIFGLLLGCLVSGALVYPTIPNYIQNNLRPSIYYMDMVAQIDRYFLGKPEYSDRFIFAQMDGKADTITIEILTDGYLFRWRESQVAELKIPEGGGDIRLDIYTTSWQPPLEISATSQNSGKTVYLNPLDVNAWHAWKQIGLEGISYQWVGGGN